MSIITDLPLVAVFAMASPITASNFRLEPTMAGRFSSPTIVSAVSTLAVCVTGAAGELLNLMLYRHALGLPVPGVDSRDLPRLAVPPGSAPPTAFGSGSPPAVT